MARFFLRFQLFSKKMLKMTISTSVWGAQHPSAGENIQHTQDVQKLHRNRWIYPCCFVNRIPGNWALFKASLQRPHYRAQDWGSKKPVIKSLYSDVPFIDFYGRWKLWITLRDWRGNKKLIEFFRGALMFRHMFN